ncbi:hypothetical protein LL965_04245 [Xanthomonas cassavae CFBP 4642]|uniref:Uncharacterized protein n=1 Tax=Xanthomonas cassavae CFBP 4642 TaxID=1219375 RepID=A0ABS8HAY2_9XANT|nr:hypothetical protein [Xanthomonas cassavae]MCC4619325.1 hypothetical protein [Xanthomonas cassavae CFBP 4642]
MHAQIAGNAAAYVPVIVVCWMSLPLMGPGTHWSWLHRAEATTHQAWTAGIGRPPAALRQQVLPWRYRVDDNASSSMCAWGFCSATSPVLALSVFRRACVGTLANVVIPLPASQGISDAQSLVRQGFDRKLSVR